MAARTPGSPTSLKQGDTAATRRAYALTVANSAPDSDDAGFATRCRRWLHLELLVSGGTSADYKVYFRRTGMSDAWALDTRVGTAGTKTVTSAGGLHSLILEIDGCDRVYVMVDNFVGGPTGVDVWLGTCGDVDARG